MSSIVASAVWIVAAAFEFKGTAAWFLVSTFGRLTYHAIPPESATTATHAAASCGSENETRHELHAGFRTRVARTRAVPGALGAAAAARSRASMPAQTSA